MSHLERFFAAARERAATLPGVDPSAAGGPAAGAAVARRSLRAALAGRDRVAVIAEFKRRSPSRGPLGLAADPADHAGRAAALGAAALSVLTEPRFFDGGYADLAAARAACELPILAKDFVVDARQIAMAARHGADAVLLILRGLDDAALAPLLTAARGFGLEVVLECHDADEVGRALAVEDAIVGVNNRDLDTLATDLARARALLPLVPEDRIALAESGYRSAAELAALRGVADGVLIGTSLMLGADLGALVGAGRSS